MMTEQEYETFSEEEKKILERYVTNTSRPIFALHNLPEVIKGALFSRYSRSSLGLRSLLLKEFILKSEDSGFSDIAGITDKESSVLDRQSLAIQKAQNFYDRILDGYGDDSIGELGGAHLAVENVSMIAAKAVEDHRIGGSPLEKSTRYIHFDQKLHGEYRFYREPILMTSAYRDIYIEMCNDLFSTYSRLIPPLTEKIQKNFPHDPNTSPGAYKAALRAKVLDALRGLLPASTLTNMGVYGNGRFFDALINKLQCQNLTELQELGKHSYEELAKIIPSFVRRAEPSHPTQENFAQFYDAMQTELRLVTAEQTSFSERTMEQGVSLIDYDHDGVKKVAAALLFAFSNKSFQDLYQHVSSLGQEEIARILDAGCNARENRRHKSPRALEHATFTFEMVSDFGAYRDLHRHRLLTQERQLLSCDYGFYIPPELEGMSEEGEYKRVMLRAKEVYDQIATELPEEAQYVVPMGYNVRWYFHVNLRALQWLCELRSAPAGHPTYRMIAQVMARQVCDVFPEFERFFRFVDYEGYDLGRMDQEQRKAKKAKTLGLLSN